MFDRYHRNWAATIPVKYERNIQYLTCGLAMLKNGENNGTEEIALVTPTPGSLDLQPCFHFEFFSTAADCHSPLYVSGSETWYLTRELPTPTRNPLRPHPPSPLLDSGSHRSGGTSAGRYRIEKWPLLWPWRVQLHQQRVWRCTGERNADVTIGRRWHMASKAYWFGR